MLCVLEEEEDEEEERERENSRCSFIISIIRRYCMVLCRCSWLRIEDGIQCQHVSTFAGLLITDDGRINLRNGKNVGQLIYECLINFLTFFSTIVHCLRFLLSRSIQDHSMRNR